LSPDPEKRKRIHYGRRQGRPLRKTQRERLTNLLPGISIGSLNRLADPPTLFDPPPKSVGLEVGFGGGEHLAAQAKANPDVGFIGCEPFINGVARLLRTMETEKLANIRIYVDDARQLIEALPDQSIDRCFILFPDPWPKRRHHRRRIVSPETLAGLARILRDGALLRLASDDRDYIRWMLFHTLREGSFEWRAQGPSDWRNRPADWPPTRYEEKAAQQGESSIYLEFYRRRR
jgi:tRNA (guanine-N7-)-methyltransferase